jgi:hypothetical protein
MILEDKTELEAVLGSVRQGHYDKDLDASGTGISSSFPLRVDFGRRGCASECRLLALRGPSTARR